MRMLKVGLFLVGYTAVSVIVITMVINRLRGKTLETRSWVHSNSMFGGFLAIGVPSAIFMPSLLPFLLSRVTPAPYNKIFEYTMYGIIALAVLCFLLASITNLLCIVKPTAAQWFGPKWYRHCDLQTIDRGPNPRTVETQERPGWAGNSAHNFEFTIPESATQIPASQNPEQRDVKGYLFVCREGIWSYTFGFGEYGKYYPLPDFAFQLSWSAVKTITGQPPERGTITPVVITEVNGREHRIKTNKEAYGCLIRWLPSRHSSRPHRH